ncbi:unnamed protein product, partial [Ectocarpus sp. 13 AM-2016]
PVSSHSELRAPSRRSSLCSRGSLRSPHSLRSPISISISYRFQNSSITQHYPPHPSHLRRLSVHFPPPLAPRPQEFLVVLSCGILTPYDHHLPSPARVYRFYSISPSSPVPFDYTTMRSSRVV